MPRQPRMNRKNKPSLRKAKKVVAKAQAKKRSKQLDTYFLKVKMEGQIIPVQGVSVANYINQWLPLCSGTSAFDWTKSADYITMKYQYDQVRINGMRIVITPKANVLDQVNAQNDANLTLIGDGMIHTAIDRDSQTPANISAMTRYSSYKRYSLNKKFSRTYQIKWAKGVWLDCGSEYANTTLLTQIGAFGGIGLYAENLIEDKLEWFNEPYADITIYYNVVLRGKITPNTGYDASGNVVLYKPETLAYNPQSAMVLTAGGLAGANRRLVVDASGNFVDLSGNVVDETHAP